MQTGDEPRRAAVTLIGLRGVCQHSSEVPSPPSSATAIDVGPAHGTLHHHTLPCCSRPKSTALLAPPPPLRRQQGSAPSSSAATSPHGHCCACTGPSWSSTVSGSHWRSWSGAAWDPPHYEWSGTGWVCTIGLCTFQLDPPSPPHQAGIPSGAAPLPALATGLFRRQQPAALARLDASPGSGRRRVCDGSAAPPGRWQCCTTR